MNKTFKKLPIIAAIAAAFSFSSVVFADESNELVGKGYGGLHGMFLKADNDRMISSGKTSLDHASGFGGELGFRFSPSTEFRLSYTDLNVVNTLDGFAEPSGSSIAFDTLYFLDKKNVYLLAGLDKLKLEDNKISADLGVGYRHYFNERFAAYIEGKGHYQFANDYTDFSSRIGLVYFFGDFKKSLPKRAEKPVVVEEVIVEEVVLDSDQDGVIDSQDQCANTPMSDQVDANGCTIFAEEEITFSLAINFANNHSNIESQYYPEIAEAAEFLKTYSHVDMVVNGYTSRLGSAKYNKWLSQKRADAVVNVLVNEYGIDKSRLMAVGYGEENLLNPANTPEAHKENRRIEAVATVKEKVAVKRN